MCVLFLAFFVLLCYLQAPKCHTFAVAIYDYHNFELEVVIAKITQNFLDTVKNENNTFLKEKISIGIFKNIKSYLAILHIQIFNKFGLYFCN